MGEEVNFANQKWIVLCEDVEYAMIISMNVLFEKKYNEIYGKYEKPKTVTWANCSLREYLNNDYLTVHLSKYSGCIKDNLADSAVYKNGKCVHFRSHVSDKIFILSKDEYEYYFVDGRIKDECKAAFWLRTPTVGVGKEMIVRDGKIEDYGLYVSSNCGVRPVLCVKKDVLGKY